MAVFLHNGLGYLLGYGAGRLYWYEYCKEENNLYRSWYAECRTCYQPCNHNGTVCGRHRNPQLSVLYPVHGILFQEHFSQDYLQHMIREKQESLQIKSRLQKM